MVIGVLEEAGVDLHLARQHRLERLRHVVPGGDLLVPRRQLCVRRDHAELLLPRERLLAHGVPALVELALVLGRPLLGHVMRSVRRAGREVGEERLVGHQRLLLPHPVDRPVGHVLGEVVPLLGQAIRLDRDRPVVERRGVLVRLAAQEPVEVLEPAATGRPRLERAHRTRLPDRHLVTLTELRRRIAVQLERLGQRRRGVGSHRVVPGRRRRDLRDAAHPDRVVIAPRQERLARRRAQRRRVKAGVAQTPGRELLGIGRGTGAAEGARRAEAAVVDQDHEHVRRGSRRAQRHDRRKDRVRIFRVVGDKARMRQIGNRQAVPPVLVHRRHVYPLGESRLDSPAQRTLAPRAGRRRSRHSRWGR